MKSLVFVIQWKWNYGFNVLFCYQFVEHKNSNMTNSWTNLKLLERYKNGKK